MKRVTIICEGPTEKEFCNITLGNYFKPLNIYLHNPLIKRSGGGIVPWSNLKQQIENHLNGDTNAYVTTLIDYYGIPDKFNYPEWEKSKGIVDKFLRMDFLENAMKKDISNDINYRFLPYIQLHEFEGLLFNNISVFDEQFEQNELLDRDELIKTINSFENPEMINNDPSNAPSKRLDRLIKGYNKVVFGDIIAGSIGLSRIRNKCTRFNNWIEKIENL